MDTRYVKANRLILPDYSESMTTRIKAGRGCGSQFFPGWEGILEKLNADLAEVHPEYVIDQIKIKFGHLRYYVSGAASDEAAALITQAEVAASKVCSQCGEAIIPRVICPCLLELRKP